LDCKLKIIDDRLDALVFDPESISTSYMPIKKIIIVATTAMLFGLMIWANTGDGAAGKTADGAATGQPTSLVLSEKLKF
jgi:hypothetical protein